VDVTAKRARDPYSGSTPPACRVGRAGPASIRGRPARRPPSGKETLAVLDVVRPRRRSRWKRSSQTLKSQLAPSSCVETLRWPSRSHHGDVSRTGPAPMTAPTSSYALREIPILRPVPRRPRPSLPAHLPVSPPQEGVAGPMAAPDGRRFRATLLVVHVRSGLSVPACANRQRARRRVVLAVSVGRNQARVPRD